MSPAPAPREVERLAELARYAVLDTDPEPVFDDLVHAACVVAGTPTALVSLVDADRQWFKARVGMEVCSTDRDVAFCSHVVEDEELLVVPDATADDRFAGNPLVTGHPGVRFYAGFPLRTPTGHVLGTLCVVDYTPRQLDATQLEVLEALADQVMGQLELRRQNARLRASEVRLAELVAEQRLAQIALNDSEQRFRSAFESAPVGMFLVGLQEPVDGRIVRLNAAMGRFLGRSEEELLYTDVRTLGEPGHEGGSLTLDRLAWGELGPAPVEVPFAHADGRPVWGLLSASTVGPAAGEPYVIALVEDITARRELEAQLVHQALHDPLTGLPNRTLLGDRLDHALAAAVRSGRLVAVLYLDLDGFKAVNDGYGHNVGDELLMAAAGRLHRAVRPEDTVARLGGDEFVVCATVDDEDAAVAVAERVQAALARPFALAGGRLTIGASVGVAVAGGDGEAEHLLRDADQAMYRAKRAGKGRIWRCDAPGVPPAS